MYLATYVIFICSDTAMESKFPFPPKEIPEKEIFQLTWRSL